MTSKDEDDSDSPDVPEWELADRKRGILTQFDRELLMGLKDLEGQELRNARYRIRQRIIESLNDLFVISIHLEEDELKKVFDDDRSSPNTSLCRKFIRFAYKSVLLDDEIDNNVDEFEEQVGQTLFNYHDEKIDRDENPNTRIRADAEIELQKEEVDLNEMEYRIQRGEATLDEAIEYVHLTSKQDRYGVRSEAMDIIAEELPEEVLDEN